MLASFVSALLNVAKLLGCNAEELKMALSTRKMRVGNDNIVQKLTVSQVSVLQNAINLSVKLVK